MARDPLTTLIRVRFNHPEGRWYELEVVRSGIWFEVWTSWGRFYPEDEFGGENLRGQFARQETAIRTAGEIFVNKEEEGYYIQEREGSL